MIGEGSEPEAVIPLSKLLESVLEELYEREALAHHLKGNTPQINQTVNLTNGIDVDQTV